MAVAGTSSNMETRILLIGKAGVGKSSTGNTLLGSRKFDAATGSRVLNKSTECRETTRFGRKLVVVDTPGFIHTDKNCKETAKELSKIVGYMHQGFHAMIYVMGAEKFSGECIETRDLFLKVFGEKVMNYTLIVVTHLDLLQEESFDKEEYLSFTTKEFRKFQKQCGHRVIFIDNKESKDGLEEQAKHILNMVDDITRMNDKPCFINCHLELASSYFLVDQKTESHHLNRAKRELFRRVARAMGIKRALYWDKVKHVPVNKEAVMFATNPERSRRGSIPSFHHLETTKPSQKPLPDTKEGLVRRYSVCADVAAIALTLPSQSSNDTDKDEETIDQIDDVPDNDFPDDVLKILENVEKVPHGSGDTCSLVDAGEAPGFRDEVCDKEFFEQFEGFMSYFFIPMVNAKNVVKK